MENSLSGRRETQILSGRLLGTGRLRSLARARPASHAHGHGTINHNINHICGAPRQATPTPPRPQRQSRRRGACNSRPTSRRRALSVGSRCIAASPPHLPARSESTPSFTSAQVGTPRPTIAHCTHTRTSHLQFVDSHCLSSVWLQGHPSQRIHTRVCTRITSRSSSLVLASLPHTSHPACPPSSRMYHACITHVSRMYHACW